MPSPTASEIATSTWQRTRNDAKATATKPNTNRDAQRVKKADDKQPKLTAIEEKWADRKWCPDEYQPRLGADGLPGWNLLSDFYIITHEWLADGRDLKLLWAEGGPLYDAVQDTHQQLSEQSAKVARKAVRALLKASNTKASTSDAVPGLTESDGDANLDNADEASTLAASSKKRAPADETPFEVPTNPKRQKGTQSAVTMPSTPLPTASRHSPRISQAKNDGGDLRPFSEPRQPTLSGPPPSRGGNQSSSSKRKLRKRLPALKLNNSESVFRSSSMESRGSHFSGPKGLSRQSFTRDDTDSPYLGHDSAKKVESTSFLDSTGDIPDSDSLPGYETDQGDLSDEPTMNAGSHDFPLKSISHRLQHTCAIRNGSRLPISKSVYRLSRLAKDGIGLIQVFPRCMEMTVHRSRGTPPRIPAPTLFSP